MRVVRERPRVVVMVGWVALALLLIGALVGATVSAAGEGERREVVEDARREARTARERALEEAWTTDELAGQLGRARRRVAQLGRALGDTRREAKTARRRAKRSRR